MLVRSAISSEGPSEAMLVRFTFSGQQRPAPKACALRLMPYGPSTGGVDRANRLRELAEDGIEVHPGPSVTAHTTLDHTVKSLELVSRFLAAVESLTTTSGSGEGHRTALGPDHVTVSHIALGSRLEVVLTLSETGVATHGAALALLATLISETEPRITGDCAHRLRGASAGDPTVAAQAAALAWVVRERAPRPQHIDFLAPPAPGPPVASHP